MVLIDLVKQRMLKRALNENSKNKVYIDKQTTCAEVSCYYDGSFIDLRAHTHTCT